MSPRRSACSRFWFRFCYFQNRIFRYIIRVMRRLLAVERLGQVRYPVQKKES